MEELSLDEIMQEKRVENLSNLFEDNAEDPVGMRKTVVINNRAEEVRFKTRDRKPMKDRSGLSKFISKKLKTIRKMKEKEEQEIREFEETEMYEYAVAVLGK